MKSVSYVIDPDGDIELVLNEPNTQNIIPQNVLIGDEDATSDSPTTEFTNSELGGRYTVFDNFDTPTLMDHYGDSEFAEETPDVVRMRVSSKHLTFASKIFRTMLQGPWAEATTSFSSQRNPRQVSTSAWDAKAFAIVLDAIHGRARKIPKRINLVLLARIATIADYYQCYESLELISNVWLSGLWLNDIWPSDKAVAEEGFDSCTVNSLLRLYVGWVFEDETVFSREAHRALRHSKGLSEFQLNDLPVGGVLDVLDNKRTELIGRLLKGLDDLRESLHTEDECPGLGLSDCSSTLLGMLMREGVRWQKDYQPLTTPYCGHSVVTMMGLIEEIPRPKPSHPRYNNSGRGHSGEVNTYHRQCSCTIQGRMQALVEQVNKDSMRFYPSQIQGWGLRRKESYQ